ncbi:MAG: histidine phosphatase family protein [Cellulomonadaceae bacterium]
MAVTTVHLLRHGEVHNPAGVLYGRLPGYHLSVLGGEMAERVARYLGGHTVPTTPPGTEPERHDVTHVIASPLQRAQETAAPVAREFGLDIETDERLLEAENSFEGEIVGSTLRRPRSWPRLVNPLRPSWGEPYVRQAARMRAAIEHARREAEGHEAVLVSHQLPIWIARLSYEGRRFPHDPRKRQCSLASLTSLRFDGDRFVGLHYAEPCADLLPGASTIAGA